MVKWKPEWKRESSSRALKEKPVRFARLSAVFIGIYTHLPLHQSLIDQSSKLDRRLCFTPKGFSLPAPLSLRNIAPAFLSRQLGFSLDQTAIASNITVEWVTSTMKYQTRTFSSGS